MAQARYENPVPGSSITRLFDSYSAKSDEPDELEDIQPKWFQSALGTLGNHATFTHGLAG